MKKLHQHAREGAASILGVAMVLTMIVLAAVCLDFGTIKVAQAEIRRSADAAAMAACWEMFESVDAGGIAASETQISDAAGLVAGNNYISNSSPGLGLGDVEIGTYTYDTGIFETFSSADPNAVRVTLRRQESVNGKIPLFFGGVTGRDYQSMYITATAAMFKSIEGFEEPPDSNSNINLLPIALDLETWENVLAETTSDNYEWNGTSVVNGSDGIVECNLYPKGNGSPGNRGTVDIGGRNNSTNDLARQVVYGISKQDFIDLGKPLEFDDDGVLELNGDTGISAGIKDELASIVGQKRIIPIFESVSGNGNNAMYRIVKLEGIRILDVKLTGPAKKKHLTIQPANVLARGGRVATDGSSSSKYLYTPVMLVE